MHPRLIKTTLLLLLASVFASNARAQDVEIDSILAVHASAETDSAYVQSLFDIIWNNRRNDPYLSLALLDHLSEHQKNQEISYQPDVTTYYYGVIYKNIGEYKKSETNIRAYYDFHAERKDTLRMGIAKQILANLFADLNDFTQASKEIQDALNFAQLQNDSFGIANMSSRLGYILLEGKRSEDALSYQRKALKYIISDNMSPSDSNLMANIYNDIGIIYEKEDVLDSMMYYYRKYYNLAHGMNSKHMIMFASHNLGLGLEEIGNYSESMDHLLEGLALANDIQDQAMITASKISIAGLNTKIGNYNRAIAQLKGVETTAREPENRKDIYSTMHVAYKNIGDNKNAYNYLVKLKEVSDSLLNEEITTSVNELETKYNSKEKENEIALLNTENELIGLRLNQASRQKWFFILGLLALCSIIALLYRNISISRKNSVLLRSKNEKIQKTLSEKEMLLKEIHHRVKNNLQVISSLLSLQSRQIDDPTAQLAIKEGRNRVKSMALIHQNLYQDADLVGVNADDYIAKLSKSLINSYQVDESQIDLIMDVQAIKLDVDTVIPLGLILNELISNALKYAFDSGSGGQIKISLEEVDSILKLVVSDNGKGLPNSFDIEKSSSLGYKLIRAFSDKLKAELYIDKDVQGTSINLNIPNFKAA